MDGRKAAMWVAVVLVAMAMLPSGCEQRRQEAEVAPPRAVAAGQQAVTVAPAGELRISGPYQHANLAVFLVHGSDTIEGGHFLTLDEALDKKVLVVHETDDVNELSVDNQSETESIFIQGGEIVSGGKQDRMLGTDLIVPPRARNLKIASFCVEQGRWSQRGGESVRAFACRSNLAFSREMKIAARRDKSQAGVWAFIRQAQWQCLSNVAEMRLSPVSPSSLDLTLEDPKLKAKITEYTDPLAKLAEGRDDVVGFAYAVNGELHSADIYGSRALFSKLWPKLLEGSAVEAISKLQKGKAPEPPTAQAVSQWVTAHREGKGTRRRVTEQLSDRLQAVQLESDADVVFDLFDTGAAASVHTNYIRKPKDAPAPPPPPPPPPARPSPLSPVAPRPALR